MAGQDKLTESSRGQERRIGALPETALAIFRDGPVTSETVPMVAGCRVLAVSLL